MLQMRQVKLLKKMHKVLKKRELGPKQGPCELSITPCVRRELCAPLPLKFKKTRKICRWYLGWKRNHRIGIISM